MSGQEGVETLPSIIRSLAQQVATRDTHLKNEQSRHEEELASVRLQQEEMRLERDKALRSVEDLVLMRNQLTDQVESTRVNWETDVENVKMRGQMELAQEKVLSAKLKADFELERAELTAKIRYLEQTATRRAEILLKTQKDAEDWERRFTAVSDELRKRTDEWAAQFSRVARSLEELSAARRNSDLGSSPTAVPPHASSSPVASPTKQVSLVKDFKQPRSSAFPRTGHSDQIKSPSTINVRPPYSTSLPNASALKLSKNDGDISFSPRKPQVNHTDATFKSSGSPQRLRNVPPEVGDTTSFRGIRDAASSSHSTLPPDRVIITAHYEIKKEDDEDAAVGPSLEYDYHVASGSGTSHSRDDDIEEDVEPVAKRRKATARTQSARRLIRDDDEEENQLSGPDSVMGVTEDARGDAGDDFDEMAIGAEDNHNEVYGHRRVNVREVNKTPRTPPHRPRISHSDSSSKKRKAALPIALTNARQSTTRKR